jgi:hypothetical protein
MNITQKNIVRNINLGIQGLFNRQIMACSPHDTFFSIERSDAPRDPSKTEQAACDKRQRKAKAWSRLMGSDAT